MSFWTPPTPEDHSKEKSSTAPKRSPDTDPVYAALERDLLAEYDPDYPPHDEEAFQEGYPRKGTGGYGSPGQF